MHSLLALVVVLLATACQAAPTPTPGSGLLEVEALAGPVCPVETDPPDPDCAPRPVEGALILVQPGDGRDIVVAQGETDADGRLQLELPPGDYFVFGADVEGLMGTPEPMTITVEVGETVSIELGYDTGIR